MIAMPPPSNRVVSVLCNMASSLSMIVPCAEPRREDTMNNLEHVTRSHHIGWGVLFALCSLAAAGCAPYSVETIEMTSFDSSQDQKAIVGYYRDEAMDLREKAAEYAKSAIRYERLFGPQSDWVSGAKQLSQYYAEAAQDLERLADAHAKIAGTEMLRRQCPAKDCSK